MTTEHIAAPEVGTHDWTYEVGDTVNAYGDEVVITNRLHDVANGQRFYAVYGLRGRQLFEDSVFEHHEALDFEQAAS